RDGIHVVTGLVSLKTHAKLALVVRRDTGGSARRYAHIGSGNYNPETSLIYADVGLFTTDQRITADVHALFNELTGSSRPPRGGLRNLLVAPADLLDRLLALIERETAHARAGRPAPGGSRGPGVRSGRPADVEQDPDGGVAGSDSLGAEPRWSVRSPGNRAALGSRCVTLRRDRQR